MDARELSQQCTVTSPLTAAAICRTVTVRQIAAAVKGGVTVHC